MFLNTVVFWDVTLSLGSVVPDVLKEAWLKQLKELVDK